MPLSDHHIAWYQSTHLAEAAYQDPLDTALQEFGNAPPYDDDSVKYNVWNDRRITTAVIKYFVHAETLYCRFPASIRRMLDADPTSSSSDCPFEPWLREPVLPSNMKWLVRMQIVEQWTFDPVVADIEAMNMGRFNSLTKAIKRLES